jgi:hypothetical protein
MVSYIGLASDEYVSKKPFASPDKAFEMLFRIQAYLKKLYAEAKIAGYFAKVIRSDEDLEYEDLNPEIFNEQNGTIFPSVWVNVTYKYSDKAVLEAELNQLNQTFDLVSI